mmetsp:Transcript_16835/g.48094  ORF Transcript_16835/g.48094 Transcript_16835/m.48094 type:complete len:275 (+) Transcript_16835:139-963(+)
MPGGRPGPLTIPTGLGAGSMPGASGRSGGKAQGWPEWVPGLGPGTGPAWRGAELSCCPAPGPPHCPPAKPPEAPEAAAGAAASSVSSAKRLSCASSSSRWTTSGKTSSQTMGAPPSGGRSSLSAAQRKLRREPSLSASPRRAAGLRSPRQASSPNPGFSQQVLANFRRVEYRFPRSRMISARSSGRFSGVKPQISSQLSDMMEAECIRYSAVQNIPSFAKKSESEQQFLIQSLQSNGSRSVTSLLRLPEVLSSSCRLMVSAQKRAERAGLCKPP